MIVVSDGGERKEFLTPDLVVIPDARRALIYDRIRGHGCIVGYPDAGLVCDVVAKSSAAASGEIVLNSSYWQPVLSLLRERGFLRPTPEMPRDPRFGEAEIASGVFARQLSLMVAVDCNYACKNCFVFNEPANSLPRANAYMSWDVAEEALLRFLSMRAAVSSVDQNIVRIFGGEPLLNWPLIEKITQWVRSRKLGWRIYLTTNGALLDRTRAAFLESHEVTVFLSINGVKQINDQVRVNHREEALSSERSKGFELIYLRQNKRISRSLSRTMMELFGSETLWIFWIGCVLTEINR